MKELEEVCSSCAEKVINTHAQLNSIEIFQGSGTSYHSDESAWWQLEKELEDIIEDDK